MKKLFAMMLALVMALSLVACGGNDTTTEDTATTMSDNDSRVQFLESLGWQVTTSPKEASQVKIPTEQSPAYSRYNDLQKSQGYDLSQYAGKTVMRYVYEIKNFPGAEQPVYATVLVYKNQIIGGDITNTAAKGAIQGLTKAEPTTPTTTPSETTIPTE